MSDTTADEQPLINAITPFLAHPNVATPALLFCLKQDVLSDTPSSRRRDFFNIPVVWHLAQQNDCYLIREMNALRAGKQEKEAYTKVLMQCTQYAKDEALGKSLAQFFVQLKHPIEDEVERQRSLNEVLEEIKTKKSLNEANALSWLRELMLGKLNADKWTFYSLVQDRYAQEQEAKYTIDTMASLNPADKAALQQVKDTHDTMNFWIQLQAMGMFVGGFTFGIEVGMLILEEVAEEDWLAPWMILMISAVLCGTLGSRLGLFFFRAHVYELEKQSKETYYNTHYNPSALGEHRPASVTALVGTGAEGLLVLFGLVTSGMFTCDMTTMAIRNAMGHGEHYKTDIFGTYFWNKMMDQGDWGYALAGTVSVLLGIAAIGSAVSLTCGHYALDGQETKAYEAKKQNQIKMRQVG